MSRLKVVRLIKLVNWELDRLQYYQAFYEYAAVTFFC